MQLSYQQVANLIKLTVTTKDDSLGCDGCLELMDQFAQAELDGTVIPDALETVKVHLEQCKCCKDEYEALMIALREVKIFVAL
jgi:hypothetical protein